MSEREVRHVTSRALAALEDVDIDLDLGDLREILLEIQTVNASLAVADVKIPAAVLRKIEPAAWAHAQMFSRGIPHPTLDAPPEALVGIWLWLGAGLRWPPRWLSPGISDPGAMNLEDRP